MFHVEQNHKTNNMENTENKTNRPAVWKEYVSMLCNAVILICSIAMLVQHYKFDVEMSVFAIVIWWVLIVYSIYRTIAIIVSRLKK